MKARSSRYARAPVHMAVKLAEMTVVRFRRVWSGASVISEWKMTHLAHICLNVYVYICRQHVLGCRTSAFEIKFQQQCPAKIMQHLSKFCHLVRRL